MAEIQKNLTQFTWCLEQNVPIVCKKTGEWRRESSFGTLVRWLSGDESGNLIAIAQAFCSFLDKVEKSPVIFSPDSEIIEAQKTTSRCWKKA